MVGPTTIGTAFGHALSFDPLDQLFQSFGPLLVTLNPANGAFTAFFVGMSPFPVGAAVNGMDFAGDGTLFAILDLTGGSGPADLITIDPVTGLVTDLGPTANDMDALAVAPGHIETVLVEVPTSAPDGSTHTNCVDYTVTHSSFAAGTKDIQACHIATVESAPIVEFTKTYELVDDANDNGLAEEGDVIRYTLTIGNTGNEDIEFLEIVDLIEGGLDLGAGGNLVAGPFDCQDSSGTKINCDLGLLAAGTTGLRIVYDVTVAESTSDMDGFLVCGEAIANTAFYASQSASGVPFNGQASTGTPVPDCPVGDLPNGLYHIDPFGNPDIGRRDEQRNIVGYQHTVCLDDDEGLDIFGNPIEGAINADTDGVNDIDLDSVFPLNADDDKRWRIDTVAGSADLRGVNLHTMDIDGDSIFEECISWYSGNPGEQDVTIIDEEGEIIADWADGSTTAGDNVTTDCDLSDTSPVILGTISGPGDFSSIQGTDDCESIGPATPLVKEWNIFDHTDITEFGGLTTLYSTTLPAGPASTFVNWGVTFNPATSTFTTPLPGVGFDEHVLGTHASLLPNSGDFHNLNVTHVVGTEVTFSVSGTCGQVTIDAVPGGVTAIPGGPTTVVANGNDVTVTSVGVPIDFWFQTNNCTQQNNSWTKVTITVGYPNVINSNSHFVPGPEMVRVNWVPAPAPAKQVFLAWAGQRIILEYDWRLPAGDFSEPGGDADTSGVCAFSDDFDVTYIKGGGPGNFLPGPNDADGTGNGNVTINGNDEAVVRDVDTDGHQDNDQGVDDGDTDNDDIPNGPQDSCISRVLFESEDQGQVDIEAFVTAVDGDPLVDNQTKIAWVIYYMKINRVELSLVTSVSKPLHNVTMTDWDPGNPWDYTLDVTSTEWNVSKDLLVRARVSGWFLNSNPSGRPRDDSNPLNVLPADRWWMPYDWPILAGGPADPADGSDAIVTAENFSPSYDLMIAPNNGTEGSPGHRALAQTGDTPLIRDCNPPGAGCTGRYIRVGGNEPFHGPLSLVDLVPVGLSGALADTDIFDPLISPFSGYIRDTIWGDGDVDKYDAPMPVAELTADIRGSGFIREVKKQDVYYLGAANPLGAYPGVDASVGVSPSQLYPNPYYLQAIPGSPYIPAVVAGGGYEWDTWGPDGPDGPGLLGDGVYRHWLAIPHLYFTVPGSNRVGVTDTSVSGAQKTELGLIRSIHVDHSINRTLVIYTDNHGEGMVEANGDFKLTYDECDVNFMGGFHCSQGDVVGNSTIYATADYPDFRGKHAPVRSNDATVSWTWGGYKTITVEDGETEQFKYVVFHAVDRDGFCSTQPGHSVYGNPVSLHPVLSSLDDDNSFPDPVEQVDFLIDGGQGKFVAMSHPGVLSGEQGSVKQVPTFSTLLNNPAAGGVKEFPTLNGSADECQAWVKVSSSLLDLVNVFIVAYDDEGVIGFDELIDFTSSTQYSLTFRWSLITRIGADGISPTDALSGTGANAGGDNIMAQVTAVYGWEQASQTWLGFFPAGLNVPGANDLTRLTLGNAYWIAITAPGPVTWTVITDIN